MGTIRNGFAGSSGSSGSTGASGSSGTGGSGAVIAFPLLTYTWNASLGGQNGADNASFTGIPIGSASSDRLVIVIISKGNGVGTSINSCTINGAAATEISAATGNGHNNPQAVYYLKVTSGTTCDMSFTGGGGADSYAVSVFTLTGQSSDTPVYAGTAVTSAAGTISVSTSSLSNATILAAINSNGDLGTYYWNSPISFDAYIIAATGQYRGAQLAGHSGIVSGAQTVSVYRSNGTNGNSVLSVVAWQ